MKTWTVTAKDDRPLFPLCAGVRLRSYDNPDQAATEIINELGYELTPCCYSEDGLCAECAKDAQLAADLRAEDAGIEQDHADHERECRGGG